MKRLEAHALGVEDGPRERRGRTERQGRGQTWSEARRLTENHAPHDEILAPLVHAITVLLHFQRHVVHHRPTALGLRGHLCLQIMH